MKDELKEIIGIGFGLFITGVIALKAFFEVAKDTDKGFIEDKKKDSRSSTIFFGFIIVLLVFLFVTSGGWEWLTCERGEIIGEFVSGETEGFGDFCGQYPSTSLKLRNYSVNGEIESWGNRFHFGNEIGWLDELESGECYVFYYHMTSRMSDVSPSHTIYYYVVDDYKEI